MIEHEKLKNIFAFLSILFGEDEALSSRLMSFPPCYIIEKWERYVETKIQEHPWGMHPNLRTRFFDRYFEQWCKHD